MKFCFEQRVDDIKACEQYFIAQQLAEFGYPHMGGTSNRDAPVLCNALELETIRHALDAAWRNIILDAQNRIERRQFTITGVQTLPDLREGREPIPNQWAMDFKIDPLRSVVVLNERRYVNVLVERAETSEDAARVSPTPSDHRFDPNTIPELTDETILSLLEEHARRVIASPESKLIAPGKVSLLPIIRGKMRHRGNDGELLPSLRTEAEWLARWVAEKVTFHQLPTAATIAKVLGSEYSLLKARSRPAI